MITFGPIVDRPTGKTRQGLPIRVLTEDLLVYQDDYLLTVIPAGFESDGTSIPWFARWKWSNGWKGCYAAAAYLHDDLLENSIKPKWEVDWLYMGALRSCKTSALESGIFWLSVRTKRTRT